MGLETSSLQRRLMRWGWSRRLILWLTGDRILSLGELAERLSCPSCSEVVEHAIDFLDEPEPQVRVVVDPLARVVIKGGRAPVTSCWQCNAPLEEIPAI